MRIKMINSPRLIGYIWAEVAVGVSFVAGVGFSFFPF